jgi:hypothetical protein
MSSISAITKKKKEKEKKKGEGGEGARQRGGKKEGVD